MRKACMVLLVGSSLSAATIKVPADYSTIQEGIDAAVDGDTVLVAAGEYVITESVTFAGKPITVRGEAGAEETIIRMSDPGNHAVLEFTNGESEASVLEGFTLTGGGTGVFCTSTNNPFLKSSPVLTNCTISGNGAWDVYCRGPAELTNCTIVGNLGEGV